MFMIPLHFIWTHSLESSYSMQLFIEEYTCFLLISDGSIPILSIDTIGHAGYRQHRSIGTKVFIFYRQYRSSVQKKFFSPIKSNHRLKIFFSSKDHRSNRCFLQLIDYRYRSNRCFFRHRCPPMPATPPPQLQGHGLVRLSILWIFGTW